MAVKGQLKKDSGPDKLANAVGAGSMLLSTIGYMLVVVIILAMLTAHVARMFGMPIAWLNVPAGDLVPMGIFLFCAAFALK